MAQLEVYVNLIAKRTALGAVLRLKRTSATLAPMSTQYKRRECRAPQIQYFMVQAQMSYALAVGRRPPTPSYAQTAAAVEREMEIGFGWDPSRHHKNAILQQ
jgi:hypothetical protein